MESNVRSLLFDIVESGTLIEDFVAATDFEEYFRSEKTKAAVERQFLNIGEALNRF